MDVKLNAEGTHFFVADQGRHGVMVIEPESMTEVAFLPTGAGAHGMAIARDTRALYVTNRLAGTLSRTRWLLAHAGVVLAGLVVIVLGASLVLALTTGWSVAAGVDAGPMIWSGLAYLPAELVLAGLALAVYGLRPRAFPVAWAAYAVTVFIAFLGPGLKLGQWLLDLAPTTHVGNPPLGSTSAIDLGVLTALAFVLALVGVVAFRRRGIPQG